MAGLTSGTIRRSIGLLILLAVLPGAAILFNHGMLQRKHALAEARQELLDLTGLLAHSQKELVKTTRILFSSLVLTEDIRSLDPENCRNMLSALVETELLYQNFAVTDLEGKVVASAKPMKNQSLSDRKHVQDALKNKRFTVGEFIFSRSEDSFPALPFSCPIYGKDKNMVGLLTCAANLHYFKRLFDAINLPGNSVVSITDFKGTVIYAYPVDSTFYPLGKSINSQIVEKFKTLTEAGIIIGSGIRGERRIYACQPVFQAENINASTYILASVPEAQVLKKANTDMFYNLVFMFLVVVLSLIFAWWYGKTTIQIPIANLTELTGEFSRGNLGARIDAKNSPQELLRLTNSFHQMAESLEKSRHALADEKERLAVTLKSIGDGVITTDIEGKILLINQAAAEIIGCSETAVEGRMLDDFFVAIDPESRQKLENPVKEVISTGRIVVTQDPCILIGRNAEEKFIADSGAPIRNQGGEILGVVIVFRDVTQELRLKEELVKVGKLESIGVLAGGIAHDFNNILAGILGNIDLALLDKNIAEKPRKFLHGAVSACERARNLTHQLLTFARGGDPVLETASLAKIIKETAEFATHGSKSRCEFDIPEDIWLVEVDPGQISQVIQNLIINAAQAMPEGGRIKISCKNLSQLPREIPGLSATQKYLEVKVKDEGQGIPPDIIDKIFDPFYSTKEKGHGLGLAICNSIITKHGGNISVNSSRGRGTEFQILLPVSNFAMANEKQSPAGNENVRSMKIMIMDDEEMIRVIGKSMLEELGHQVLLARDGHEAIEIFAEHHKLGNSIDLVIMDLTIPGGMGGKEAVGEVLKIAPDARVVVSSGYSQDPVLANFRQYGFTAALVKPFGLKKLAELLQDLTLSVND